MKIPQNDQELNIIIKTLAKQMVAGSTHDAA